MAVSKRLRFEILRRDGHTCRYCGLKAPEVQLRVDHVIPQTLGGTDHASNLVTACEPCNSGKSSLPPDAPLVEDVAQSALRWRAAMHEARVQLAGEDYVHDDIRAAIEISWSEWMARDSRITPLPADWVLSVGPWVEAGLLGRDIERLMEPAMLRSVNNRWAYFCGTIWRYLDALGKRTLEVVDTDPSSWVTQP